MRLIDDGQLVGVFPEATISRSWLLKPFKRGAAGLAVSRQVPLVPVVVWGGHRIYTVDGHRSLRRRMPITVSVGEPLIPGDGETIDELSARLHTAMEALLDEAIDTYPVAAAQRRRPLVGAPRPRRHRARPGDRSGARPRGRRPHRRYVRVVNFDETTPVTVGELTFDVRFAGPEDGTPVMLLHGFPETSLSWSAVAPLLADAGLRVIAPDQRGYSPGARPAEVADYATDVLADDVVAHRRCARHSARSTSSVTTGAPPSPGSRPPSTPIGCGA